MRVACVSDMHGQLKFDVPESDLLLIAGDLCPAVHASNPSVEIQANWLNIKFRNWLAKQPVKETVFVAGNHDWIWEVAKDRVPKMNSNVHYLEDSSIDIMDLKIYGTPVQLSFYNWAFNRDEEQIQGYWGAIPSGLDILLLHSPPYGILDSTHHLNYASKHMGSKSLLKRIKEVRPKLVVFGHNHGEHGIVEKDGIKYINASLVDEKYKMIREPIVVEL